MHVYDDLTKSLHPMLESFKDKDENMYYVCVSSNYKETVLQY